MESTGGEHPRVGTTPIVADLHPYGTCTPRTPTGERILLGIDVDTGVDVAAPQVQPKKRFSIRVWLSG